MADNAVESSVFQAVIGAFCSPVIQNIGDVCDLGDHLTEVRSSFLRFADQAVVEDDDNVGGALRIQLRNDLYDAEDFLQSLTTLAATLSGEPRSEGMEFEFGGVDP